MSSYYEGLPIYKAACDLCVRLDAVVRGFPRYHKYTLGARLRRGGRMTAGVRWTRVAALVQRALARGLPVALALEQPRASGNVKARRLAYLFEPLTEGNGPVPAAARNERSVP